MYSCQICNREKTDYGWCDDCTTEWKIFLYERSDYYLYEEPSYKSVIEWAANMARKFQKEKTKVLVDALEEISNMEHANDYFSCEGYCHVECADQALEEYKKEKE